MKGKEAYALLNRVEESNSLMDKVDKPYDGLFSLIITRNPQAILDLLYPGSVFVRFHDTKLTGTQRLPDKIMEAKWRNTGKHFLAQPDCQSRPDSLIALRQLLYHVLILWQPWQPEQIKEKIGVYSKTLNLTEEAKDVQDLLHLTVPGPDGQEMAMIDFSCGSRVLSDWTPEELIALEHKELFAFLPATRGGATREWVEYMIAHLQGPENGDLLFGGLNVAELMFDFHKQYDDLKWLRQRRKKMINDPIITGTEFYQEILTLGEAQGRAKAQATIQAAQAAEEEAKVKIAQALQAKAEIEAQLQAEARAKAEIEAQLQAEARAKAEIEAQLQAEARAKAEIEAQLQAEIRTKIETEAAAKIQLAQAEAAKAKAEAEAQVQIQWTIGQVLAQARQSVLQIMLKRFLALAEFANNLVAKITNPTLLQDLLGKLAIADNAEEAEQCLRNAQAALA